MKILFTGGGTGGHFYPIIAIIDALNEIIEQKKIINPDLIFMSDSSYDDSLLLKKGIRFKKIETGKLRRYFSLLNIIDIFKTFFGLLKALWIIYFDFPDVIFSKGGYASFPAVFSSRVFGIPLIIHESDAAPGAVNKWAGKFAKRIAVSFSETIKYFQEKKTALTGNPIRKEFLIPSKSGAKEFLKLEENIPIILVIGGSQGAKKINDNFVDIVPELVKKYQIIHQTGKNNIDEVKDRISVLLDKSLYKHRYFSFGYLNESSLKMAYGAAGLVISRAGSGSIFEIAASGLASIVIPIQNSAQDHQRKNAYAYAQTGASVVIEENNFSPNVLLSEINRLIENKEELKSMSKSAKEFAKPDAAEKIAREIITLALEHA
jgi:UDP-N-acetylglucosamine--N-acetylmuramyl-(pentapeptide) pyrophosphoryl-undecaprenol N-acetylglucosamine transferase